jgi:hypothetical protein
MAPRNRNPKHGDRTQHATGRPTSRGSRSGRKTLEVRPETVRDSGEKAARLDLESNLPLGERTAFQEGLEAAHGEAMSNRIEQAVAQIGAVDEELADVEREKEWRENDVERAEQALENAVEKRDKIPRPRLVGQIPRLIYAPIMALFAVAEYPLLKLSFTRLPVDDTTIRVIAILVGATLVAGVHVLGLAVSRLVRAEGDRIEGRRDWLAHRAVVALAAVLNVFVVVGLAIVRAGEIAGIGAAFGGHGVSQPVWLGVALGCLQGATLLAAFYLAYYRARGVEWRDAQNLVNDLEAKRENAERALEEVERREARLLVSREAIPDRADHDLDRLLRHHQLEEAKYLAILARHLEGPPKPIGTWDTTRTPRARHASPADSATSRAKRPQAGNGKPSAAAARRVKHAMRDHETKEGTL